MRSLRYGLASLALMAYPTWSSAQTQHTRNPETGLDSWEFKGQGVRLKLTQITPDMARGFYLARGFSETAANAYARGCIFQTEFQNESLPAAIRFALADWRVLTPKGERPLTLEPDWQREWAKLGVSAAARSAFRWAQYPAEHSYEPGDWNMGMTSYGLPPGSRFDLRFTWTGQDGAHRALVRDLRCADDVN